MATELAKAYVQIVPSARGIQGSITRALGGEASAAGDAAGQSFGSNMIGTIKGALAAAGIGAALTATIKEGAALEQSIGGIETLFKDSADKVKAAAAEAYRTAGMSANEYMQQVTSFSATLLKGLGGDTAAAAEYANQALVQMSDNANKMGTDMSSIQMAYQGFAKDNYAMLDNLKLGYGGTQSEMARLINDSGVLGDTVEVTAETVKDIPFDQMISAIGVIQDNLGITGATANEAATTLSGSFAAMAAAGKNVLGKLTLGQDIGPALSALAQTVTTFLVGNLLPAVWNSFAAMAAAGKNVLGKLTLGQDIGPALSALAQTVTTFLVGNLLPAVWNILKALPGALVTFIQTALPQLVGALMQFVPQLQTGIAQGLPQMLAAAGQIVAQLCSGIQSGWPQLLQQGQKVLSGIIGGITTALPQLFQMALDLVTTLVNTFVSNFPLYIQTGTQLLLSLIDGIGQALPGMLEAAAQAVLSMAQGLIQNFPQIIQSGFEMMASLIRGIGNALPGIAKAAGNVARKLLDTIKNTNWLQLGKDIIAGMINGIGAMAGALWDAATNIARAALDAIKSFFGIASPSRLMRDEVGRFIPAGIAAGIEANTRPLTGAMQRLAHTTAAAWQADLPLRLAGPAVPAGWAPAAPVAFSQTIYTHDSLSPAELTRQAQDFLTRARWKNP